MESELLSPNQVELMFKFRELINDLSEEQLKNIYEELELEITDEELLVIKEEQDRLLEEKNKIDEAKKYLDFCNQQFNNIIRPSHIPGFDVNDPYFS